MAGSSVPCWPNCGQLAFRRTALASGAAGTSPRSRACGACGWAAAPTAEPRRGSPHQCRGLSATSTAGRSGLLVTAETLLPLTDPPTLAARKSSFALAEVVVAVIPGSALPPPTPGRRLGRDRLSLRTGSRGIVESGCGGGARRDCGHRQRSLPELG